MTVTKTDCSKYRGRFWWAIGLLFAAVLGIGPSIYGLYGVSYDAKAEAQNAKSDTKTLKVEVEAHYKAAEAQGKHVSDALERIERATAEGFERVDRKQAVADQDIKTLLRNGKGE